MIKHSRQRDAIRQNLMTRYDHPTAETVYLDIREEYPSISLGTVYRNLSLLAELGEIQKITTSAGPDRFDGNPKPHCHFLCNCCGSVLDIPLEQPEDIIDHAAHAFPGEIEGMQIQFHGKCENCIETH